MSMPGAVDVARRAEVEHRLPVAAPRPRRAALARCMRVGRVDVFAAARATGTPSSRSILDTAHRSPSRVILVSVTVVPCSLAAPRRESTSARMIAARGRRPWTRLRQWPLSLHDHAHLGSSRSQVTVKVAVRRHKRARSRWRRPRRPQSDDVEQLVALGALGGEPAPECAAQTTEHVRVRVEGQLQRGSSGAYSIASSATSSSSGVSSSSARYTRSANEASARCAAARSRRSSVARGPRRSTRRAARSAHRCTAAACCPPGMRSARSCTRCRGPMPSGRPWALSSSSACRPGRSAAAAGGRR